VGATALVKSQLTPKMSTIHLTRSVIVACSSGRRRHGGSIGTVEDADYNAPMDIGKTALIDFDRLTA
jgi:hypothetical protein